MEDYKETKADQIRRLLAIGEMTKAQIARAVGCRWQYVYHIANASTYYGQRQAITEIREELRGIKALLRRALGEPEDIIRMRLSPIQRLEDRLGSGERPRPGTPAAE